MGINEKVNAHIAQTKQAIDQVIAPIASSGETIMPETLEVMFGTALKKFNITKTNVLEDWVEVLGSPKGLANEFGELKVFYDALNALPELDRLYCEMKDKEQQRQKAWADYAMYLDNPLPNPDPGLPDPFQNRTIRRQVV